MHNTFMTDIVFMLQHVRQVWYIHSVHMASMNDDLSKRCL